MKVLRPFVFSIIFCVFISNFVSNCVDSKYFIVLSKDDRFEFKNSTTNGAIFTHDEDCRHLKVNKFKLFLNYENLRLNIEYANNSIDDFDDDRICHHYEQFLLKNFSQFINGRFNEYAISLKTKYGQFKDCYLRDFACEKTLNQSIFTQQIDVQMINSTSALIVLNNFGNKKNPCEERKVLDLKSFGNNLISIMPFSDNFIFKLDHNYPFLLLKSNQTVELVSIQGSVLCHKDKISSEKIIRHEILDIIPGSKTCKDILSRESTRTKSTAPSNSFKGSW